MLESRLGREIRLTNVYCDFPRSLNTSGIVSQLGPDNFYLISHPVIDATYLQCHIQQRKINHKKITYRAIRYRTVKVSPLLPSICASPHDVARPMLHKVSHFTKF